MINYKSGFIALISAIIISVLLLIITLGVSMSGIFSRFNILDSESKERSIALAESCVDTAVLDLAQSISISFPATITVSGSDTCKIISETVSGSQTTIKTQAVVNKAYTNLTVVIDSSYSVVSWVETAN